MGVFSAISSLFGRVKLYLMTKGLFLRNVKKEDLTELLKHVGISIFDFVGGFKTFETFHSEVTSGKIALKVKYCNPQEQNDPSYDQVSMIRKLCLSYRMINVYILDHTKTLRLVSFYEAKPSDIFFDKLHAHEGFDEFISRIMNEYLGLGRESYEFEYVGGTHQFIQNENSREYPGMQITGCESWTYEVSLKKAYFRAEGYEPPLPHLLRFKWEKLEVTKEG